jgi:RTX calcium-binding nonapeptide repeat (4 copies)
MLVVPASALAGPVILGGDDLTEHGQTDGAGNNEEGWLYMERAVGNLLPNVTRANDNSIAALGSSGPLDPDANGGNAGAGITSAAAKNGMTVQYFDGAANVANALTNIGTGSYNPAIIWVAGSDASNDLDGCDGAGTEGQALIDQANVINDFVSQGGGLFSHGTCYAWLTALLPSVSTVDGGSSDDLYRTAEGVAAFPGVSDADFNAGPWHNHFEGDFGGLQVLVRSGDIDDATGTDAAVVLGGGDVSIIPEPPETAPAPGACSNQVIGDGANNNLTGTDGPDNMKGLLGNDTLTGLGGDDCIRGGPGKDKEFGGDGNDQLNGGQKKDKLDAGGGDDLVKVRAGRVDRVDCGAGNDTVRAGKQDKIADNCETVNFGR